MRVLDVLLLICSSRPSAAAVYAHVDADGSITEARRMMRVEEASQREGMSDRHLASVGLHRTDTGAKDADSAYVQTSNFVECSVEGGTCACDGVVLYGRGASNWRELRAEGSVLCTAAMFDTTPAPEGELNACRCYSMHWCGENNVDNLVSDSAHRRRNAFGIPGRNLHQRRRWCGWGSRDCTWSSWSKWSDCSGGKQCAETGVSQRSRKVETEAANGGTCTQLNTSEETKCHWVGCKAKGPKDPKGANSSDDGDAAREKKRIAARSKINSSLTSEKAEAIAVQSADRVRATAEAAGVAADLATKARSAVLATARAEIKALTPARLGRIAAEAFLPAVKTVSSDSSELRASVVSLAGEVILLGIGSGIGGDELPDVDALASEIADALGLLAPTSAPKPETPEKPDGVQVFGSATKTTTVAAIPIFPKEGLQG